MVNLVFLFALIVCTSSANAITPAELRAMSADKDRENTQRSSRANTGAVDTLLPQPAKQPTSSKYSGSTDSTVKETTNSPPVILKKKQTKQLAVNSKGDAATPTAPATQETATSNQNIYIAPARQNSTNQMVSDAIPATLVFGIRLGTWMPANLNRDTSSAEPGSVELSISEDVIGDKRTLPAGTVLFANKRLNSATKRMEMVVTHGITPSGQEFKLRGIIFDPLKVSGLSGIYQVDEKAVAKRGVQKGVVAAVGAAAQSLGGLNPLAIAGGAATQSVLSDAGGAVEYNAPTAVIYVSPQPLIIRVEERF